MSVYKNSKELPALGIFEDLFNLAFNCKWEGEKIVKRNPGPTEQKNLSLLLAWPGILMIHLAQITGDTTYQNCINELKGILDDDSDSEQIREFLDSIIESKKIPKIIFKDVQEALNNKNYDALEKLRKEIHQYLPKIFINLLLLLHPKNLSFVLNSDLIVLVHTLSNYYVLCCMTARCFQRNDGDRYITNRELNETYFKCGLQNQLDIYSISRIWPGFLGSLINIEVNNFSKSNKENKNLETLIFSRISTPQLKTFFYRIFPENTFAYIRKFDADSDKFNLDGEIRGIGYNISRNLGYENDLWRLFSFKNPKSNGYLFFNEKNDLPDVLTVLVKELFRSARQSAIAINSIIASWDNFLKDPYEIIDEKLEKFDEWIFSFILDSYQSRDEFYKFKSFTRVIGDIDTELDYEIVNEVRDTYKEAKYYHIPIELRQKLLEAKEELDIFVKLVIKKLKLQEGRLGDEDNLLNYFDAHKEKFNYLNLLEHNDIKKLNFLTGANASRDNRRKILPIINKKLGGKNYKESTLTKLLGLEPGGEKYLKYSK
jgi:hypothetical protein